MSYMDSAPVVGSVTLEGVWLHDPADPEGTVRHFRFGKSARDVSLEVAAQESVYAGREYPVVDFGPFTSYQVGVRIDVPFGSLWAADIAALQSFATARRILSYRDNRGRVFPARLSNYREQDTDTGSQVTMNASRVDA